MSFPPSRSPAVLSPPVLLPTGTRDILPAEYAVRDGLRARLSGVFRAWGYQGVEVPALEYASRQHPMEGSTFKLIDSGGEVLALRSEFTTAIGRLVQTHYAGQSGTGQSNPEPPFPLRLQYGGRLWLRTQTSELGRLREFSQVGVELIGVEGVRADVELLALAREALQTVQVQAEMEVGYPGFVDAVLEDAGLHGTARDELHRAIDRKSGADVEVLARQHALKPEVTRTLHHLIDLYGGPEVLAEAGHLAQGARARAALEHLAQVARACPFPLLFDLGVSRRYGYYTGITFRAYTPGMNQPVLGGGRYALPGSPPGAGFAIGLERLARAVPAPTASGPERVLALDLAAAQAAREAGLIAELAWTDDLAELRRYARARGLRRVVEGAGLVEVRLDDLAGDIDAAGGQA